MTSVFIAGNRVLKPTSINEKGEINGPARSGRRRREQTMKAAMALHGGKDRNTTPAFEGMMAVMNASAPVSELIAVIKKCPKFTKHVIPALVRDSISKFEKSHSNFVRSVHVLYRGGIASKRKYQAIRSSLSMCISETGFTKKHVEFMPNTRVPNLLTYQFLLSQLNEVNIGPLYDVRETLCNGLDEEMKVNGKYRDLTQILLRLAEFYLTANRYRRDKLNWFGEVEGAFKVAIGGDGAPFGKDDQALSWLISFVNCGQRVCSPEENFLLFGANCPEDCEPVRRYLTKLTKEMQEIEGQAFTVLVEGEEKAVSFKFVLLPNDMKYLAFLGGELTISATYFSPFADVKKSDMNNLQLTYGPEPDNKWKPWRYDDRIIVAAAVGRKKEELSRTALKPATKREKITSFISQKKSRQEFVPLVANYIDKAKAEPLHLKNNAWQHWHRAVMKYALSQSNVENCQSILQVPLTSCFGKYYHCIKFVVKATRLAKKLRKWFMDGRQKNKDLEYRFTGKESRLCCQHFMAIIQSLQTETDNQLHLFQLHVFAYTALNLRDAISLYSRVYLTFDQVQSLQTVCSNYSRATALFLKGTPTSWTIGHVVPVHVKQLQWEFGLGLGVNTMEGRESKHVALAQFAQKTQFSNRWAQVFKHEYISLLWLRENGCDDIVYRKTNAVYIPNICYTEDHCYCGQSKELDNAQCQFCSDVMHAIVTDCVKQGNISKEAKRILEKR